MRPIALALALLAASALGFGATRGPDAGGYTGTDAAVYSFIDVSATGGASVLADTDDGVAALTLPFPFNFYGQTYTRACVSSNGSMYFVSSVAECNAIVDFANTDLTATSPPGDWPALLPFWSDLTFEQPGAGAVFYQTLGEPGARVFVVQWNNAYPVGSNSPVTFQVTLSEAGHRVLFQYKTVDLGVNDPASRGGAATIGVRNTAAVVNKQQIQWSFGAAVVGNDSALLFAPADSTAPTMTCSVTPAEVWPPNGRLVPVRASVAVEDSAGGSGAAGFTLVSVVSSEPAAAGDIAGFGIATPDLEGQLRARRNGAGVGRTYTLTYEGRDRAGNTATCALNVVVPHDQGRRGR